MGFILKHNNISRHITWLCLKTTDWCFFAICHANVQCCTGKHVLGQKICGGSGGD